MEIKSASVKVMRSYDYCHFEICLSSDGISSTTDVNDLRKQAAILADEAVEQYKVSKANATLIDNDVYNRDGLKRKAQDAEQKPESERTPNEKAAIKYFQDGYYQNRPRYNYSDDWEEPNWDEEYDDEYDNDNSVGF